MDRGISLISVSKLMKEIYPYPDNADPLSKLGKKNYSTHRSHANDRPGKLTGMN